MSDSGSQAAKIWSEKLARLNKTMRKIMRDLGNDAVLFFNEQFKKAKTPDDVPWTPRKDGDSSRSLLVKSGRLRRSIRLSEVNKQRARITTNVPYAVYHNEGTGRIPQRRFLGRSEILLRRLKRLLRKRIEEALK